MGFFQRQKSTPDYSSIPSAKELSLARERVSSRLEVTPLTTSPGLSELLSRDILLKWESKHRTGSFKERGVVNFLLALQPELTECGVCAASAGNHALALSYHASKLNIPCTIVMPKNAALVKIESTRKNGASVVLEGQDFDEAYHFAMELAQRESLHFVPGFDHSLVVAGQSTCGQELLEQDHSFDSIVVSIGGGGLAAGIAMAVKLSRPDVFILGVQSDWVTSKTTRDPSPLIRGTLADGIAVKTFGKLTERIIQTQIDQLVSVSDEEIAEAIVKYLEIEKSLVEGAGAAGLAALIKGYLPAQYQKPVVIVCGSNIDAHILSRLIEREQQKKGRLFRVRVSVPDRPGSLAHCTRILSESGVNVLETFHDRHFSQLPGNVDITFLVEVRDKEHRTTILESLGAEGLSPLITN